MCMSRVTTCNGKVSYPTKADARRAAKMFHARKGGMECHHFFCEQCGQFHIGRPPTYYQNSAKARRAVRLQGAHGAGAMSCDAWEV